MWLFVTAYLCIAENIWWLESTTICNWQREGQLWVIILTLRITLFVMCMCVFRFCIFVCPVVAESLLSQPCRNCGQFSMLEENSSGAILEFRWGHLYSSAGLWMQICSSSIALVILSLSNLVGISCLFNWKILCLSEAFEIPTVEINATNAFFMYHRPLSGKSTWTGRES
jgi:hypothetical protein